MMQEYWIEKCVQESEKERPDGAKRAGGGGRERGEREVLLTIKK
jgi:hypothetical protein